MELIIANVIDAYRDNVALIQDPELRESEIVDSYYIEDRSLLWCGRRKVVVTSLPVEPAHVRYLQQALGYELLENLSPREASDSLCADILREPELQAAIVARLRGEGTVPLIPFVASAQVLQVAEALRRVGADLTTPECPLAEHLPVRDDLDSKAGFRRFFASIAHKVEGLSLPEGAVARDTAQAARLAANLLGQGHAVLCKPNNSQSGVGFVYLRPGELQGSPAEMAARIQARLDGDSQMTSDLIVVEELIDVDSSVGGGSPSIEMRVPADPRLDVEFMYPCGQILTPSGYFFGVEMYREVLDPVMLKVVEAAGKAVAREVRKLGYVGIFDMDMVAGKDGRLYAVEINTRRTGGTHAHEAAEFLFGPRYWERVAVISNNVYTFDGPPLSYVGLRQILGDILFPLGGQREGVLPTIVSSLPTRRFGYIVFGTDIARARALEKMMVERLADTGRTLTAAH